MNDFFNGKFGLILAPNEQADFVELCNQNGIGIRFSAQFTLAANAECVPAQDTFIYFDTDMEEIGLTGHRHNDRELCLRKWQKQKGFFERINITTEDSTVKVNFGNKAAGVAKCRPCDEFDLGLGTAIAMCRVIGVEKFNKALEIVKEG